MSLLTLQRWGKAQPVRMDDVRERMDDFPVGLREDHGYTSDISYCHKSFTLVCLLGGLCGHNP